MRVFISQPMNGRSDEEILKERDDAIAFIQSKYDNVEIVDSFFDDFPGDPVDKPDQQMIKDVIDSMSETQRTVTYALVGMALEEAEAFPIPTAGDNQGLWYLGKSLQQLSNADAIMLVGDWRNARGCKIERLCASEYGIREIIVE